MDQAPEAILKPGMEFCGVLVLPGPGRIDGCVRGEIIAGGPLWIGEAGEVEADLEGDVVIVAGRVKGDVRASERIELRATARVEGGLWAPRVALAEGSSVNGPCVCGSAPPARPAAPKTLLRSP
ncbi:MAG: polymer-forming cytoskeletal protein [Myxococcales bacterium]|nr:polymer-forming cytoskeletal protein [Myxococcales bacterium]MDH5565637.1 polymer-forming cytoskeletal protein [Myxococcales bacterium]